MNCLRQLLHAPVLAVGVAVSLASPTACGSSPKPVRLLVDVFIQHQANENSPIGVSFVAVRDAKFLETVSGMEAKAWFEQREQLHRDDPSGQKFTEWQWEFVPGNPPPRMVIEVEGDTLTAFVFANYRSPGAHRVRVGPYRKVHIELGDDDFSIRPLDTAQKL